jgi:hypothetical protein
MKHLTMQDQLAAALSKLLRQDTIDAVAVLGRFLQQLTRQPNSVIPGWSPTTDMNIRPLHQVQQKII